MTNKEWIESRGLDFSAGLKLWDKDEYPDFSEWLKTKHEHKFKVGDVLLYKPLDAKYVIIGVGVKDGDTGFVYAYNAIRIWHDGRICFTPNEDIERGNFDGSRAMLFNNAFDDDPDYVKIA